MEKVITRPRKDLEIFVNCKKNAVICLNPTYMNYLILETWT
jgi:hypothetical protein